MLVVGEHASSYISQYSNDFQHDFLALLSRRWGTKRVRANQVYQEFIQDKHHSHMNATRWVTLTAFVQHLGRSGIVHADETEKGWFIAWIDNSPKALAKQDAALKKERQDMNDEERERKLLKQQMERVRAAELEKPGGEGASASHTPDQDGVGEEDIDVTTIQPFKMSMGGGLLVKGKEKEALEQTSEVKSEEGSPNRPTGDNIDANPTTTKSNSVKEETGNDGGNSEVLSMPPIAAPSPQSSAPTISAFKPKANVFKLNQKPNPLKNNPLKSSSAPASEPSSLGTKRPISAVEAIVMEEMEKKRRREQSTWSGSRGHGREGLQTR